MLSYNVDSFRTSLYVSRGMGVINIWSFYCRTNYVIELVVFVED